MNLRDYQRDGITALRAQYKQGRRAPGSVLPTGGGKTLMAAYAVKGTVSRGNEVLILVHRRELLHQTSATLAEAVV